MQLLDPHSRFQSFTGRKGILHYAGRIDRPWAELLAQIEEGRFPEKVRGNFALVYLPQPADAHLFTMAVDHVASIPLFVAKDFCSNHFSSLAQQIRTSQGFEYDREFFWESHLFWGYSASERTTVKAIRRLPPGCLWQNGKIRPYMNLNDHMDTKRLSTGEFTEVFESVVLRGTKTMNALLASGGTDSATLMAVVSKLQLKPRFRVVSVRSNVETHNEKALVDRLAQKLDLKIHYFDAPVLRIGKKRSSQMEPSEMFLWKDYSFLYRRMAVESVDRSDIQTVFTGECGDQLFGGPKLAKHIPFLLQKPHWTAKDVARQYIHLSMRESALEWQGYQASPLVNWYKSIDPDKHVFEKVYEETVDRIAGFFESMETSDLLNRLLNINLMFKGPYRMFHYSQDSYQFFHPFAEWDLVSLALSSRSQDKIFNQGRLKEIFFQAYQEHLVDEIWEAPKIGTAIPIQRAP